MGMTVVARTLDAQVLASLHEDESLAEELVWDEEDDDEAADGADASGSDGSGTIWLDLDKSWHGVHFLLTGTDWAAGDAGAAGGAILGGRPVGEDNGYGPARLLEPEDVGSVAAALGRVSDDDLRARFDPVEMQRLDIYPQVWDEADVLDEYLMPNVARLRDFYTQAAARGEGVLISVQ
ncbi:MAG: YfbM family protein [Terrabacter sp.]